MGERLGAMPMAEPAVVADAVEAARQDVQEKAPDEFRRVEGHRLRRLRGGGAVVLIAEADVAVVHVEQSLVGDGDTMGVAADVFEDLLGTGEGRFRIHDPVGLPRGLEMRGNPAGSVRALSEPAKWSRPVSKASCKDSRKSRRKSRDKTRTGRKKPGRQAIHRVPSGERPPPGTTQWRCG